MPLSFAYPAENMFTLYCILHEIGHWVHYDSVGRKIWVYTGNRSQAENVYNLQNKLQDKVINQGGKILPDDITERMRLLEKYNAVPCEQKANDFSNEKFGEMWKIIKSTEHPCADVL